jgi:peptide/nickel transport system substrate-binding protein
MKRWLAGNPGLETWRRLLVLVTGGALLLSGCAGGPTAPRTEAGAGPAAAPKAAAAPKVLRTSWISEPVDGIAVFGGSGDVRLQMTAMFHAGLTAYDGQGTLIPRIARKVPSLSDGDWIVQPDGTMEVTWKLRPGVKWHDGTPLSAEDFVLGIQIAKDPELPLPRWGGVSFVREVTAPDPETLLVRWSQPSFVANVGNPAEFPAVPRHIMADTYRSGDKQAVVNHPYWAREFVGLGPYRLGEWVQGSHTEGLAFDDYFLGRPKIDRVIMRYFQDANTLVANILAAEIDLVTIGTLKMEDLAPVASAWGPQGGTIVPSLTDAAMGRLQFRDPDAPWARDLRVRQALAFLIDRPTMVATFFPFAGVADVFASKTDPVFPLVEQRAYPKYTYDLARAERLMGEAGWTRGADGILQNSAGQKFTIDVRVVESTPLNSRIGLAVADQWKQGGLQTEFMAIGKNATNKNELKATHKGIFWQSETMTPDTMEYYKSNQIATEGNRWSGRNLSSFVSPEFDRMYDGVANELDGSKRLSQYADLLRWTAQELPFITGYYDASSAITAFRSGIRGPGPVLAISKVATWNVHEWEMD